MRRLVVVTVTLALAIGVLAGPAAARDTSRARPSVFVTSLSGSEEVPPVETGGHGVAVFFVDRHERSVRYFLLGTRLDGVTESHIHVAPAGENGPITAFLFDFDGVPGNVGTTDEGTRRGVLAFGTVTDDDLIGPLAGRTVSDLVERMRAGDTYVNVHTVEHRAGEIRGQI